MKKITFILILAVIVSISALGVGNIGVAAAAVSEAECDQVFVATLNELLAAENSEDTFISSIKTILYDINLEPFGYLYAFTANNEPGFAVIINTNDIYECMEIYFDAINPYQSAGADELCVYVNAMTYWTHVDETYYDARSGQEIPSIMVEAAGQKAYCASGNSLTVVPEYIYHTYRSETNYKMVNRHPHNITSSMTAGCVPTMGANIIQFYDRYAVNLIANYTPGSTIGTLYRYKAPSNETRNVITQLASDMGVTTSGATVHKFATGMAKYCSDRNYSFSYSSCMTNNSINYAIAKQQIQAGKPLALFLDPYSIEIITEYTGYDLIEHIYFDATHAMAAFGFRDVTYTLSNGQTRNDSYFQVATGNDFYNQGYLKIDSYAVIDQALAISIS